MTIASNNINNEEVGFGLVNRSIDSSLLLLLKEVGSARLIESDMHPISPKTQAPQYQPLDRKKRKGNILEDYSRDRAAETRQSHTIEHGPGQQDHSRGTLRQEQKSSGPARFCS